MLGSDPKLADARHLKKPANIIRHGQFRYQSQHQTPRTCGQDAALDLSHSKHSQHVLAHVGRDLVGLVLHHY